MTDLFAPGDQDALVLGAAPRLVTAQPHVLSLVSGPSLEELIAHTSLPCARQAGKAWRKPHRRTFEYIRIAVLVAFGDEAPAALLRRDADDGASVYINRSTPDYLPATGPTTPGAAYVPERADATILPFVNDWPLSVPFEVPGTMAPQPLEIFSLKSSLAAVWRRLRGRMAMGKEKSDMPQ